MSDSCTVKMKTKNLSRNEYAIQNDSMFNWMKWATSDHTFGHFSECITTRALKMSKHRKWKTCLVSLNVVLGYGQLNCWKEEQWIALRLKEMSKRSCKLVKQHNRDMIWDVLDNTLVLWTKCYCKTQKNFYILIYVWPGDDQVNSKFKFKGELSL